MKEEIRRLAYDLGFQQIGFSKAEKLNQEAKNLENWLNQGKNASMDWMGDHFDKRIDPRALVPGAKTVISLVFNYYSPEKQKDNSAPKISQYAYGRDYHKVLKKKLKKLLKHIQSQYGDIQGRVFVDSAPIMEKVWAQKSGIGWVGKHTNLISKSSGSFYFICEMILDVEIEADGPVTDHCGSCTACLDACPTDALYEPYKIDSSKCISYITIELKNKPIPEEFKDKLGGYMYGCDICQDVCPWNRFSKPHREPDFKPNDKLLTMTAEEWYELNELTFDEIFYGTPVKRAQFKGLKRNINFLKQKN